MKKVIILLTSLIAAASAHAAYESCKADGHEYSHGFEHSNGQRCEHGHWR